MKVELIWTDAGTMYVQSMDAPDDLPIGEMPDEADRTVGLLVHLGLPWMFYRMDGSGMCSNHSAGKDHFGSADEWLKKKREWLRAL